MLRKISFYIILSSLIILQSVLINFNLGVYIAIHLCVVISLLFTFHKISWWLIFYIGILSDLLMFRYLGFTVIVFTIISLISRSTFSFLDFGGLFGKILIMLSVLLFSICLEGLMFYLFYNTVFDIAVISVSFMWNIIMLLIIFAIINTMRDLLLKNEEI